MESHASTLNSFNMVGRKKCRFTHKLKVVVLSAVMYVSSIVASATQIEKSFYLFGREIVSATLLVEDNCLQVECGSTLESEIPFINIQNVEKMQILNCPPPEESYAAEFRTLNVNTSAIRELLLLQIKGDTLLNAKHFKKLKLKKLIINNWNNDMYDKLETGALDLLTDLTDLSLSFVNLPPLSKAASVKIISLHHGTVSSQKLCGCTELRELNLISTYPERVSSYWLENCVKLEILRVTYLTNPPPHESLNHVLEGATLLQELDLSDCKLSTLPLNWLTQAQQLRRLILRGNNLEGIVLRNIKMNSLNYLDLSFCHINNLKGLPVSNASQLEVVFGKHDLNDVQLQTADYDMLKKDNMTINVTLDVYPGMKNRIDNSLVHLNCYDCKYGSLWRAVREKRLIIDARCNEGVKLGDADLKVRDRAECETYNCKKASQCQCVRAWSSREWLAHCNNANLQTIPAEPGLQKLYAAGNDIHNINAEDLLDSLQFLDLRNNRISLVNAAAVEKLFSVPERRVLFFGNPIACVCDNQALLDALRTNHYRVDDYENLTCVSGNHDGEAISQFVPADLCTTQLPLQQFSSVSVHLGIALAVLTVICSTLLVLYCRYKLAIKLFLYTRGWCLCCMREEELDTDRPYDAFVSFSHEDFDIVVDELIPKLENTPCSYKLCLHYRDWVPGELISKQITLSVAQSKRTIIVLSKNFVKSIWGLVEFREAHINTLREKRVRVIVIILDDVLEDENLDPELRTYLQAYTYVKWGDPWFWDKLKYALPHRTRERIV